VLQNQVEAWSLSTQGKKSALLELFKDNNDETGLATSQIQYKYKTLRRIQEQNGGSLFVVGRRKEIRGRTRRLPHPPERTKKVQCSLLGSGNQERNLAVIVQELKYHLLHHQFRQNITGTKKIIIQGNSSTQREKSRTTILAAAASSVL